MLYALNTFATIPKNKKGRIMRHISIKIPEALYEIIIQKAEQHHLTLSDLVRECLLTGIKNFRSQRVKENTRLSLEKNIAIFPLATYYLLEDFIKNTCPNGQQICVLANAKAQAILNTLFRKVNPEEI
jgi:hypothetical protein